MDDDCDLALPLLVFFFLEELILLGALLGDMTMRDLDLDFDLDLVVVVVVVLLLLALRGVTILAVSFFCLDTACCTFVTLTLGPAISVVDNETLKLTFSINKAVKTMRYNYV